MPTPVPNQTPAFRPDLQGLRAVAILLVVLAHAELPIASGGFIGVDVFFVLSGYLISGLLLRELQQDGRIALLDFYARRLKRLLPALIVMLAATVGVAHWLLSSTEAHTQLASAPFAATWTSNLHFSFSAIDYFDELATRDLFLHAWSLAVEEQFYLVWPLVLVALFFHRGTTGCPPARGTGQPLPGLIAAFVLSLAGSLYLTMVAPQLAFYLMPSRVWQFAMGAIVYLAFDDACSRGRLLPLRLGRGASLGTLLAGLAIIFGSAVGLHPNLAYPGPWAVMPSLGAALVIAAGHGLEAGRAGPLAHPILVWVGDRSYSLYLWHWPVLLLGFSLGFQGQLLPTLGLIMLSILVAILSYHFVELPFWRGRASRAAPQRIVLISLLAMALAVFALLHLQRQTPPEDASADGSNRWRIDMPEIYRMDCDAWYAHARVQPCFFGSEGASRTAVFIGDSIGAQWFSILPALFPEDEWQIVVLTKSACAMVDEEYFYQRIGAVYRVCTEWRNSALEEVSSMRPDVVFVGSSANYDLTESQWVEGSARIFARLSEVAGRVVVIAGTPSLNFDGPGCLARNIMPGGRIEPEACVASGHMERAESVAGFLSRAAERHANVDVLDLNDLVCPAGRCYAATADSIIVFRDSQHLTDSFVRSRIPFVQRRLERIWRASPDSSINQSPASSTGTAAPGT